MTRGVVEVYFHSFLNLCDRWKLKRVYLRILTALSPRNDIQIPSGHSGEEKNSLIPCRETNPGLSASSQSLHWRYDAKYWCNVEHWANVCSYCDLPDGDGIYLHQTIGWCGFPRCVRRCQPSHPTDVKLCTLPVRCKHEAVICIQSVAFVLGESYDTHRYEYTYFLRAESRDS
jgi:hypothetical protein